MSRVSFLFLAIAGLVSVGATASETPSSEALELPPTGSADAAPGAQTTNSPTTAPRKGDRPHKPDTCERTSGLPSVHLRGGNDRLYGGGVAYQMYGDEGRDFLLGSGENDEMHGGDDADVLVGGGGADLFIYDTKFASLPDKKGRWSSEDGDTIVDFYDEDRDKIDLTQMQKYGRNAPAMFLWSGSMAQAYAVWTTARDGDTVVNVDLDGDAMGDLAIRLLGEVRLTPSSFCGVESGDS